ncbi:MAG TPA: hypothetical protein PLP25_10335 [Candidatus Limiplasma sp.]|nr:hypothetical protein [Candidatus Limiplasma sp.]
MHAILKRNRLRAAGVALLLSLALAGYALYSLSAIPGHFQFLWPAPAPSASSAGSNSDATDTQTADDTNANATTLTNDGLRQARLGMDALNEQLDGACQPASLYAVADGASVIAKMDNATARRGAAGSD